MSDKVVSEASWLRKSLFKIFRKSVKPFVGRGLSKRFPLAGKALFLFHRLFNPGPVLTEVQGVKLYVDYKLCMGVNLALCGSYEKGATRLFQDVIKEGMVILDLGANIGYYSLIAARIVGESGKVFAIEPAPDNFALLLINIELNGFKNIIPVQKAVSDKTGKAQLFLSNEPLFHSLYDRHEKGSIDIEVTSIDDFMKNINHSVDLVKMDVEGSEMRVLEGMVETIRSNPTLEIITEFVPDNLKKSGCSPEGFLEMLMDLGFKLYLIDDEGTGTIELGSIDSIMEAYHTRAMTVNLYCTRKG